MEQNKEQKWYAELDGAEWTIYDTTTLEAVLDKYSVGEEQARENAILAASAPQMKVLLDDMYEWMQGYMNTSELYNRNGVIYMIRQYEAICKKEQ